VTDLDRGPDDPDDGGGPGETLAECPYCEGDGKTWPAPEEDADVPFGGPISFDCPACGGTGLA